MTRSLLLVSALVLTGCGKHGTPKMKDLLPKATFARFEVEKLDFEHAETVFVFDIENPYPVGLDLAKLDWKLGFAGNPLLDGTRDKGVNIDAASSSKVRIPVAVRFEDIFAVVADAKGQGEVPWAMDVEMGFNTPIGPINVPLHETGVMPALTAPRIKLEALRLGRLDVAGGTVGLELDLALESDQTKPVNFDKFDYGLTFEGERVIDGKAQIAPIVDGKGAVTLPINLQLVNLGAAVVQALTKKGDLKVGIDADTAVATPFGSVPLRVTKERNLKVQ